MRQLNAYSLRHIENLAQTPNTDTIIERIDAAARLITAAMRSAGVKLHPGDTGVPLLDDVDLRLRQLVSLAAASFFELCDTQSVDIEGVASDDTFEVAVWTADGKPSRTAGLHVDIAWWVV